MLAVHKIAWLYFVYNNLEKWTWNNLEIRIKSGKHLAKQWKIDEKHCVKCTKNNENKSQSCYNYIEMLIHDGYVRNCFEVFGIFQGVSVKITWLAFFISILGGQTMARFTLPRDLYHGKGALEALKTFKGKSCLLYTSRCV